MGRPARIGPTVGRSRRRTTPRRTLGDNRRRSPSAGRSGGRITVGRPRLPVSPGIRSAGGGFLPAVRAWQDVPLDGKDFTGWALPARRDPGGFQAGAEGFSEDTTGVMKSTWAGKVASTVPAGRVGTGPGVLALEVRRDLVGLAVVVTKGAQRSRGAEAGQESVGSSQEAASERPPYRAGSPRQ